MSELGILVFLGFGLYLGFILFLIWFCIHE